MTIFLNCMLCPVLQLIPHHWDSQRQYWHRELSCNDTALTTRFFFFFNKKQNYHDVKIILCAPVSWENNRIKEALCFLRCGCFCEHLSSQDESALLLQTAEWVYSRAQKTSLMCRENRGSLITSCESWSQSSFLYKRNPELNWGLQWPQNGTLTFYVLRLVNMCH